MKSDLKKQIEQASDAIETMFAVQGEILPMWDALTVKGERKIFATPMVDKDAVAEGVRKLFAREQVVSYVFITEAWMVIAPPDADMVQEYNKFMESHDSLEEYPGRVEAVAFMAEDKDGVIQAHRRIMRGKHTPYLGPLEWIDVGGISHGRFVGMLPEKTEH